MQDSGVIHIVLRCIFPPSALLLKRIYDVDVYRVKAIPRRVFGAGDVCAVCA